MKRCRKQLTCRCTAYGFPHRFGGGYCNGYQLAELAYRSFSGWCYRCPNRTESGCEIINGNESPKECPVVQEFINDNEVKLK